MSDDTLIVVLPVNYIFVNSFVSTDPLQTRRKQNHFEFNHPKQQKQVGNDKSVYKTGIHNTQSAGQVFNLDIIFWAQQSWLYKHITKQNDFGFSIFQQKTGPH